MVNVNITVTLSKVMAFCILGGALALDFINTKSSSTFMFAVPFICALVMGKQYLDNKKEIKTLTGEK